MFGVFDIQIKISNMKRNWFVLLKLHDNLLNLKVITYNFISLL